MIQHIKNKTSFFSIKKIVLITSILITVLGISGFIAANYTKNLIKELFRLNKVRQEENYYMAEFEFKMLGIVYYLDKGRYIKAFSLLDRLHTQLKSKKGLIKLPKFTSKEEELEFYVNLQNSRTGAFMDDTYPLGTYHGPTENVLLHIEALAKATGRQLRLKYPLRYLDQINTSKKLIAFLDDVSTVGLIASKFPQTSFHNARDILTLARDPINYDENEVQLVIQKNNLYNFSAEWKHTLLKWFYDHQDPETGLWGPMSKNGKLLKKDINNTASIMKAFVDENGNDIHESFPLRYRNELFQSIVYELSEHSIPADDQLDEWHEWGLKNLKGIRTLTRYLWKTASPENKEKAKALIENFIRIKFEKNYIPAEGAFSYYPGGEHATLDGMGCVFMLREIGAFSSQKHNKLWGTPENNIIDLGSFDIPELYNSFFDLIANLKEINSFRFYRTIPDYNNLISNVFVVVYPRETIILDSIELVQKMNHWIDTTSQTMGNWVSKAEISQILNLIPIEKSIVYGKTIPLEIANEILKKNNKLVVIGFDTLQIPRYKITYESLSE